jgi:hypothetical protein
MLKDRVLEVFLYHQAQGKSKKGLRIVCSRQQLTVEFFKTSLEEEYHIFINVGIRPNKATVIA